MAEGQDFYSILGVTRSSSAEEIQRAYRKLARTYHPDVNKDPAAEERFKEISEAYDVLSDPETRAKYDRFGFQGLQGGDAPNFRDVGDVFEAFGDFFGDGVLGELFGGRGSFHQISRAQFRKEIFRSRPDRGAEIH